MCMQHLLLMMIVSSVSLICMDQKTSPAVQKLDVKKLFWALKYNKIHEVKYFLFDGMNVNVTFNYMDTERATIFKKVTPLIVASLYGSLSTVKLLLKHPDIKIYQRDAMYGDTALIWAARCGQANVVRQLLDAGANPFLKNKRQWTARKEAQRSLLHTYAASYKTNFDQIIADLTMSESIIKKELASKKLTQ